MTARRKLEQLRNEATRLRHRLADAESAVLLTRAAIAKLELEIAAARQVAEAEANRNMTGDPS